MTKIYLIIVLILVAVIGGVIIAARVNLMPSAVNNIDGNLGTDINEITLGVAQNITEGNFSNLKTKKLYETDEKLGLRINRNNLNESISLTARLLDDNKQVAELSPNSIDLAPQANSFCCWQIEEPGDYTLQIRRPDGITTSLPLLIRQARQQHSGGLGAP